MDKSRNVILVDAKRPDRPLVRLSAAQGSSLEFVLAGLPPGLENVYVHIGQPGVDGMEDAEAALLPDGTWSVYLSGLYFPSAGTATWCISATDGRGNAKWFGKGDVTITASTLDVS